MKTTTSYAQFHNLETARVAHAAHAELMRAHAGGPGSTELYLYYRPMELGVFPDKPDDTWTLGENERVPTHCTEAQLAYWFAQRTARLPYLTGD